MRFDYIIAGAGCAGLSLVYHLLRSSLNGKKVLLLDTNLKNANDRTWCFWAETPYSYKSSQKKYWKNLEFFNETQGKVESIAPYAYYHIRGLDFYNEVFELIRHFENVEFIQDKIIQVEETEDEVKVSGENGVYYCDLVFNSTKLQQFHPHGFITLKQHFHGWFIEYDRPVFDFNTARLMDFRGHDERHPGFFYLLPFTENKALIEYTIFSHEILEQNFYENRLFWYIDHFLQPGYSIKETETGVIPMTNYPFPAKIGKRIINIGTQGGMTKPTTGYTFKNIQCSSATIVNALIDRVPMPTLIPKKRRFSFYDELLLKIIDQNPAKLKKIFSALFLNNSVKDILKFMDEETSISQEAKLFFSLPWKPFIKSWVFP